MLFDDENFVEATSLTKEQYQGFLQELEKIPTPKAPISGQAARLCIEFMEDTGCRVNETIHVRKKDIDWDTRILTVTQPKSEKECKCSRWMYRDQYTRIRVLEASDPNCVICHGKGKWKKPQKTTITPRLIPKLLEYCGKMNEDGLLFPVSRQRLFKWSKKAGENAGLRIFQDKEEKTIKGVFLHLFRALCSKRMKVDAQNDPHVDELIAKKLRHAVTFVTQRYTKIDLNYLLNWEAKTYQL